MDASVKQRVKMFLKYKDLSVNQISKLSGLGQVTINAQINGDTKISVAVISFLLDYYTDLSAEWLMRGVGEMESRGYRDDKGTEIHIDASGDHVQGDNNITHSTINQAPSEELIELRVENKLLKEQVSDLRKDKDNLTKLLLK